MSMKLERIEAHLSWESENLLKFQKELLIPTLHIFSFYFNFAFKPFHQIALNIFLILRVEVPLKEA